MLKRVQQLEFEGYGPKSSKSVSEDISNDGKESPDSLLIKELVSDDKLEKKTVFPTVIKIEFVRPKQQEKPVRKPVKYTEIHMTGNKSYLCEYEEIDGGYVTFGGDPKGGKITDTEYVVLSLDFKLLDESQVLLRVLRKNNMYSVDLNNVAPLGVLTCLFTKATLDESNLSHRRLGHINFKTMNKLVMDSNHQRRRKRRMLKIQGIHIMSPTANVASIKDNDVDEDIVYGCADDLDMPNLKEIIYSVEYEDVDGEADMTNFDTNIHQVWTFMDLPYSKRAIGIKWIYKNNKDKRGIVVRNKARFEDPEFLDMAYKIEKALYGLHQAPRAWYENLSTYLLDDRFHRGQIDKTLFIKRIKSDILLVQVYVDDIIFGSTMKEMCTEFDKIMHKKFQMSAMGELTFFLGLQVTKKDDGIFISQDKYVHEILKKFGFLTMKTTSTPMETSKPLLKDENAKDVDVHLYRSMIGSLMYLTSSMPDIMFVVCACARFQVTPKVSHLHAVKRIFIYLKGQPKLSLWYPKDLPFDLEAYINNDYADASLDMKSTTRDETLHEEMGDIMERAAITDASLDAKQDSGGSPKRQDTILGERPAQTSMQLMDLMELCTKLSDKVLALENNKTAQDLEITHLKKRVKRLEKRRKSRTLQLKRRLFKVRVESSAKKCLDDLEDSSKQGRKITKIDQDPDISLAITIVSAPINTASVSISTAEPSTPPTITTTIIEDEDLTIAQTLMKIRSGKSKEEAKERGSKEKSIETATRSIRGVIMREASETTRRPTGPPQQKLDPKDKAMRLQPKLEEEERQRIASVHKPDSSFNVEEWEDIQARVEANKELVQWLKEREREKVVLKLVAGSSKRDAKEALDQGGSKKQKTSESSELGEELRDKEADELSREELQ
nr:uncharacterized mitochondrial protein AtMg00810-like [Tanacetum cinerariifolium]